MLINLSELQPLNRIPLPSVSAGGNGYYSVATFKGIMGSGIHHFIKKHIFFYNVLITLILQNPG